MAARKFYSLLTLFLIIVLCVNLSYVQSAHADGETPTEPPAATEAVTEVATDVATQAPVEATSAPVEVTPEEATVVPVIETVEASPSPEPVVDDGTPAAIVFPQDLDTTAIVVLDEQGQSVALGSQDAANALVSSDPVWCPESVSVPTPGANGCSDNYSSIADLLAAMQADPASFSQNGTVFLEKTSGQGFTTPLVLDDSNESLGSAYSTLNVYNLTVQGGWNPATGTTSDQTVFSNTYIQIGSLANPWAGSLALNNIAVFGSNADQGGIQIFGSDVALTNVNSSYNSSNGISITANEPGTVALNNVTANSNGHMNGSGSAASGVLINGSDTLVSVTGGSFNNNARFGIEALNSTSTTLPVANFWTDQEDYAPGSVVTISGNDNSLNGNLVGFIPGETVLVYVEGPNRYAANCQATANAYGGWSCQITLWQNNRAVGSYTYRAVGLTSAVAVTGAFTDAATSLTVSPATGTVGGTVNLSATLTGSGTCNANNKTIDFSLNGTSVGSATTANKGTAIATLNNVSLAGISAGTYPSGISASFAVQGNCDATSGTAQLTVNGGANTATNTPTNTPTDTATSTPTDTPTDTATSTPTNTPTGNPTDTPTSTPTDTPTSTPTDTPTGNPTDTPTSTPTNTPTDTPAGGATSTPTSTPTQKPSSNSGSIHSSVGRRHSASAPGSTAFIIPLTGGELIDLDCNSVFWAFGIKLTFYNLCDQQTTIHSVSANDLPAQLPAGSTLVMGLNLDILTNGQILQDLPNNAGIEMDYPIVNGSHEQFAVLYWDETAGKWVEVSQQLGADKISQALGTSAPDELYQLIQTSVSTFYPALTTDKTGIFVLVKK